MIRFGELNIGERYVYPGDPSQTEYMKTNNVDGCLSSVNLLTGYISPEEYGVAVIVVSSHNETEYERTVKEWHRGYADFNLHHQNILHAQGVTGQLAERMVYTAYDEGWNYGYEQSLGTNV